MDADLTTQLSLGLSRIPPHGAIDEIARALRRRWDHQDESPLDLDSVASEEGIEIECTKLGGGEGGPQGLLTPLPNGRFRIEVDPTPPDGWHTAALHLREEVSRHRLRFVVAHELAHTLFYWHGYREPERLVPSSKKQEDFCDALAAALLVPPKVVGELPLNPKSAIELHKRFDVSVEVAMRALVGTHADGVGWLVIVPKGPAEPWVQWGAPKTSEAVAPWRLLSRLAEKARETGRALEGHLNWRSGRTTVARGIFVAERSQLVITARAG